MVLSSLLWTSPPIRNTPAPVLALLLVGVAGAQLALEVRNAWTGKLAVEAVREGPLGEVQFGGLPWLVLDPTDVIRGHSPAFGRLFPDIERLGHTPLTRLLPQLGEDQLGQVRGLLVHQPTAYLDVERYGSTANQPVYRLQFFPARRAGWLVAVALDRSLEHRQERDLIQAKEKLDQFLENIPGSVFLKDSQGTLVYQNQQSIFECMEFPDLLEYIQALNPLTQRRSGIPTTVTARSRRFADEVREWEAWQFPIHTSLDHMVGGILMDITNRRRQERLLVESQAFLEATLNYSPVGLLILDGKTTNIRLANEEVRNLLGIPKGENLTGRSINFDRLEWKVLRDDGEPFTVESHPIFRPFFQDQAWSGRILLRNDAGQIRHVFVNSAPIHDYQGQFLAVVVVLLDISELVAAEHRLQELNRELERRVEERTRDLQDANLSLKDKIDELRAAQEQLIETEKMASLGNLVAGVAHEINTPIGVAVTAASLLEELIGELHQKTAEGRLTRTEFDAALEKGRAGCRVILSNLERASRLIQSFKMISVDQNTDPLREFRLKDYLEDVFRSLHPPERRIHLDIAVEGDPNLQVESYPGAFSQILTNLYMNSCLHGFEARDRGQILTRFWLEEDELILTYQDDGKGMDPETQQKIFEPFFSTRRNRGGTGLGMHIVYNLVTQKLGGTITVWSEPGKGAQFVLKLPNPAPRPSSPDRGR